MEVLMNVKKRKASRCLRAKLRSPGRPPVLHCAARWPFWQAIARGLSSEDAAAVAGVSMVVGTRWFRQCGGMPPSHLAQSAPQPTGRYLSFAEREEIALARARGEGVREIARQLGRAASTISRELRRNAATRCGGLEYRAHTAQWHADRAARRPKAAKLVTNPALRKYVEDRLAGNIATPGGRTIAGPQVQWNGRRHGRRQARRWSRAWSPQQIVNRLLIDFPQDSSMRISHEAIYQALYVQGRGALRRELTACLRTGRALRMPRERVRSRGKSFLTPEIMISERPASIEDRAVPGHWEGDLILGLDSSAIGTLVERTTRFTMLLHLPPLPGHRQQPRDKRGPALAGHGAEAVREAITVAMTTLPKQLKKSLTWDQGTELAQHARLTIDTGLQVYFCDPQSPWQRGTNENTNGLLRQYFPKGTDLSAHRASDLKAVALALNTRPRKTLGWRTPAEALNELLRSTDKRSVATTR
jgi:IS30 family transposase